MTSLTKMTTSHTSIRWETVQLNTPSVAPFQGMYELRSGSADVAIEYLDQAIRSEPEDEILFIMRCKCLIK